MKPYNLHTHTTFCDGDNTPEELAAAALAAGCETLGFSGHSHTGFDERYCMSLAGTREYKERVRRLQAEYAPRLRILLGIEQDYYSELPAEGYDFVIGSVHYLYRHGEYLPVDEDPQWQQGIVADHYGGDYYAFAEDYFATLAAVHRRTGCDIVGHFDLIAKFNEGGVLFDEAHPRYRAAALAALDRLAGEGVAFEVNTGAVAKGWRTQPYPASWLLEALQARGARLVFSSDCHNANQLLAGWEEWGALCGPSL